MTKPVDATRRNFVIPAVAGFILCLLWSGFTWRYGFDIADEGYYWYGAQRMLHGEWPMRDFMAYDIGRYAWTAAVMKLLGDPGVFGARMGAAAYQTATVMVGLLLALRSVDRNLSLSLKLVFSLCVVAILQLWTYPYYKVFDYGTSILIVAMLVTMVTRQSGRAWFAAGLILGLAAIMGRNHGIYGAAASGIVLSFLAIKQGRALPLLTPALAFVAGTVIGFSPTVVTAALVPGFGAGFIASIVDLMQSGATNIALPVPWPWTVSRGDSGWLLWAMRMTKGLLFIATVLAPLATLVVLLRKPWRHPTPGTVLLLCSACAGIVYSHYAYSRADLTHLALAIAPLMLLFMASGIVIGRQLPTAIVLLGVSLLSLAPEKAFLTQLILRQTLITISINGSKVQMFPATASRLREVERVFAAIPTARHSFLAVPDAPGLYAIYQERMPIWEIYSLSKRNPLFEKPEVARLAAAMPEVVLMSDHPLDDNPELRYSKMHPAMFQWISEHYTPVDLGTHNWQVLRKK